MSHVFRTSQEPSRRICRFLGTAMLALAILSVTPQARAFPSLDEAVGRAQAHAPSAVDARGSARVAEALEAGARVSSLWNPYIELTGDRGRFTRDVQINGSLFLPIEIQGQRGARIAEWERLVAWRRAALGDALAQTLRDATEAYGRAKIASARLEQAERAEQEATLEANAVGERLRAGDAATYELSVAESETSRWAQLRVSASVELRQALTRLEELTGDRVERPSVTEVSAPSLRRPLPAGDWSSWLAANPSLKALQAESQLWQSTAERSKKEALSPLNIVVLGGRGDVGEARFGGGLAWTFPVFRRNQGEIARAESEQTRAHAVRGALRDALTARLSGARDAYDIASAGVLELQSTGIPAAERVVATALESQRAGKGELARVIIARRDLASARTRQLDLMELAWSAYAELAGYKGELP